MSRPAFAASARTLLNLSTDLLPAWLHLPCAPCASCSKLLIHPASQQRRSMKASRRKVEVIMLQDVRYMGLRKHIVEKVSPGAARNHLVPEGKAVYAHYLNRDKWNEEIKVAQDSAQQTVTNEDVEAERQKAREERLLKKLKTMRLNVDVLSDGNAFLESYKVADVTKQILTTSNIVVAPEMILVPRPFSAPGTYDVPLALLDSEGEQVIVTLQLTPKQASTAQLKSLGLTPKGDDELS